MVFQNFTSARLTTPDTLSLRNLLVGLDASAVLVCLAAMDAGQIQYTVGKATPWTGPHITAAQNVLDTAPASTPELEAQGMIANWPVETKAFCLALIDQINVIRAALPVPLIAITPAQAIAAIAAKALTL